MAEVKKKAKLAHEKALRSQPVLKTEAGSATFREVVELVEWPAGSPAAVVDFDGKGTCGIVDRMYVSQDREGNLRPGFMACPAAYDVVAQERAVRAYQEYQNKSR